MLIHPISMNMKQTGGGGMFTFSQVGVPFQDGSPAASSIVTRAAGAVGNAYLAIVSDRSGVAHTGHSIIDDNAGTWTKVAFFENEIANGSARITATVWVHVTTADDLTDTIIDADAGGSICRLTLIEVSASAAFAWALDTAAMAGSGTAAITSGVSSGAATASAPETFAFYIGSGRTEGSSGITGSFSPAPSVTSTATGALNSLVNTLGFDAASKDSGSFSTTYNVNTPAGVEGIAGTILLKATA